MAGDERATLTIDEVAKHLGVHRATAYRLAKTGEIPAVRIGGRLFVPRHRLSELLDGKHESPLERALAA